MTDKKNIQPDGLLDMVISEFMRKRLGDLSDIWVKESISLSDSILKLLGQNRNLFTQYEEIWSVRVATLLDSAYRQGFNDGAGLCREMLR